MECAVIGCSGLIGQQFVRMLADHPFFELTHVFASERSAGKTMEEIWNLPFYDCPTLFLDKKIETTNEIPRDIDLVFSGLPSSVAMEIEPRLRDEGVKVFSNASAHRMESDVPILIPEINPSHIELVEYQQDQHQTDGYIITNSNCSAAGAAIYLGEFNKLVPLDMAIITTYQAISGAGSRGVPALDISGNVIPHISNEEPKIVAETKKILGQLEDGSVKPHPMEIVANAARVNVVDGHLEAITGVFFEPSNKSNVLESITRITSPLDTTQFHVAPDTHLSYMDDENRPQPKRDVFRSNNLETQGMTVQFGRIRPSLRSMSAYVLVHNTIRGGAGGSVLNAEFARVRGLL